MSSPARNASTSAAAHDRSSVSIDSSSKSSLRKPLKLMSSNVGSSNGEMKNSAIRPKTTAKGDSTSASDHVSRRSSSHNSALAVMPLDNKRKTHEKISDSSTPRKSEQRRTRRDVSDDNASTSHINPTISSTNRLGSRQSCCKPSTSESVCFIDNNGKISAAKIVPGFLFVHDHHHHHHQSSVRCGSPANGNTLVSSPASAGSVSKKPSYLAKSLPRSSKKSNVINDISNAAGKKGNKESSRNLMQKLDAYQYEESQYLSGIRNENGEDCGTSSCTTPVMQAAENHQNPGSDNSILISFDMLSPPLTSSDGDNSGFDGDVEGSIQESSWYIGDNEGTSIENNAGRTTSLICLTDTMVEDVSGTDLESCVNVESSEEKKSKVSWMRYKYRHALQEQETEKIKLRKQEIEARKQTQEYMNDYHMKAEVQRLGSNGIIASRVKTLVEAFETIIHHSDLDGYHSLSPDHTLQ